MATKNFVVYKSSAGSGKTYTLVRAYLRLALLHENPRYFRHILAITFTNKAANEMKERVLESLRTLAASPSSSYYDENYLSDLQHVTGLDPATVQERAAAILEQMLHHYTDLGISTIDKFVYRVVRTFARDLRIPVDFDVELDTARLLSKAIDLLITKAGSDEALTDILIQFSEQKVKDDKNWHIEGDLERFAGSLLREDSDAYLRKLREMPPAQLRAVHQQIHDKVEAFENRLFEFGVKGNEIIQKSGVDATLFAGGSRGFGALFGKLTAQPLKAIPTLPAAVTKAITEGKWYAGKAKAGERDAIDNVVPELLQLITDYETFIEAQSGGYELYKLIADHLYAMSVLHELDNVIGAIKEDVNALLISDFNKTISHIVANEPAPFIFERLGERYHHFLIDEFQDTSVMQWRNLLPLVENSLATASMNLVVGDGKQAIYRWRSGEVEQFAQLPKLYGNIEADHFLEKEQVLTYNYDEQVLDTNYRSQKHIVEFNNDLFSLLQAELDPDYQNIYNNHQQKYLPSKNQGYVEAQILEPKDGITSEEANLDAILNSIQQVTEDGYELSDIAILVRKNQVGSTITQFLLERDINVVSSESMLLSSSPEVDFIVQFFELIRNSSNTIARTRIIRYICEHLRSDLHFHAVVKEYLREINPEKHTATVNIYDFLKDFGYKVSIWKLMRQPLYQSAEDLIRAFKLDQKPDAYLQFFLDAVHQYSAQFGNNVVEFLEWWDVQKNKLSVQVPEGVNAVRVMTIHKSKGLQFPVVLVPFVNWQLRPAKDLWINLQGEIEGLDVALIPHRSDVTNTAYGHLYYEEKNKTFLDNINLLYVAFTRPEERLYIFSESGGKSDNIAPAFTTALVQTNGWLPDHGILKRGIPTPPIHQKEVTDNVYQLEHIEAGDWRKKLAISFQAGRMWDGAERAPQSLRALTISALSKMTEPEDAAKVFRHLKEEGLMNDEEHQLVEQKINALATLNGKARLFDKGADIRLGTDILTADGSTYRSDRMIVEADKAIVIHYLREHVQIDQQEESASIANALLKMGYKHVETLALDIDNEKWIPWNTYGAST